MIIQPVLGSPKEGGSDSRAVAAMRTNKSLRASAQLVTARDLKPVSSQAPPLRSKSPEDAKVPAPQSDQLTLLPPRQANDVEPALSSASSSAARKRKGPPKGSKKGQGRVGTHAKMKKSKLAETASRSVEGESEPDESLSTTPAAPSISRSFSSAITVPSVLMPVTATALAPVPSASSSPFVAPFNVELPASMGDITRPAHSSEASASPRRRAVSDDPDFEPDPPKKRSKRASVGATSKSNENQKVLAGPSSSTSRPIDDHTTVMSAIDPPESVVGTSLRPKRSIKRPRSSMYDDGTLDEIDAIFPARYNRPRVPTASALTQQVIDEQPPQTPQIAEKNPEAVEVQMQQTAEEENVEQEEDDEEVEEDLPYHRPQRIRRAPRPSDADLSVAPASLAARQEQEKAARREQEKAAALLEASTPESKSGLRVIIRRTTNKETCDWQADN